MQVPRAFRGPAGQAPTPGARPSRYPGFDVLGQVPDWDDTTASVVLARLAAPPPVRFFTPAEQATITVLFDQLLDQDDRMRLPLVEMVDARLAECQTDGWRYGDMPEDGDAFRRSCAGLDEDSQESFGAPFARLGDEDRAAVLKAVLHRGQGEWHGMPAAHVWSLWTRYACTAFYSHPWAWNEIGFGGPAYPRGYKHAGVDSREPWEVADATDDDPTRGTSQQ